MKLCNILKHTQESLKPLLVDELKIMDYKPQSQDGFVYAKGSVPVLLVAHMDTVHKVPLKTICYSSDGLTIMSPEGIGGDDRCGIFMILEIIKTNRCHVLFCEDEETGSQGATKFANSKIKPDVNYIVEIDRRGSNDAVFYDCDNPKFTEFVKRFGFKESFGTFSDISVIAPALGIAAVNISAGYFNEHTLHEHIDLLSVRNNIERISRMASTDTIKHKYIEAQYYKTGYSFKGYKDYRDTNIRGCRPRYYDILKEEEDDLGDVLEDDLYGEIKTKYLMELEPPNYVINPNFEMEECDGSYYIDCKGTVYEYNKFIDYYVEADGYKAFRGQGLPATFDPKLSYASKTITEEGALQIEIKMCYMS